jgi:hypothetical protein
MLFAGRSLPLRWLAAHSVKRPKIQHGMEVCWQCRFFEDGWSNYAKFTRSKREPKIAKQLFLLGDSLDEGSGRAKTVAWPNPPKQKAQQNQGSVACA